MVFCSPVTSTVTGNVAAPESSALATSPTVRTVPSTGSSVPVAVIWAAMPCLTLSTSALPTFASTTNRFVDTTVTSAVLLELPSAEPLDEPLEEPSDDPSAVAHPVADLEPDRDDRAVDGRLQRRVVDRLLGGGHVGLGGHHGGVAGGCLLLGRVQCRP